MGWWCDLGDDDERSVEVGPRAEPSNIEVKGHSNSPVYVRTL